MMACAALPDLLSDEDPLTAFRFTKLSMKGSAWPVTGILIHLLRARTCVLLPALMISSQTWLA